MGSWLEAYGQLDDARKQNVQRWIHLNKFIAKTLRVDEREWFEDYVGEAMENPLDYSFMLDTFPGLQEQLGLDVAGQGEEFLKSIGSESVGPKVALRAENNLGKLSAPLQDQVASMLETGEPESVKLGPADVAQLQKLFPMYKPLAKLKRPDFRRVVLRRDFAEDEIVCELDQGEELLRMNVMEFAGVMSRKLV